MFGQMRGDSRQQMLDELEDKRVEKDGQHEGNAAASNHQCQRRGLTKVVDPVPPVTYPSK